MDINKIIYEVRGRRVILVKDVAKLLGMDTKRINEIVKRNIDKFSNENYFQLTKEEYEICVQVHFATLNDDFATLNNVKISRGNNLKYLPFVFTIDGIKVLKKILKSKEMDVIFNKIIEVLEEESTALIVPSSQKFREENIKSMIYEIRGKQVMLDSDLAHLYECKNGAKTINQAVERNKERFPNDFYFQLTDDEKIKLRSQSGTANMSRSNSYVFTEQGVAMLASVLRTSIAAKISIRIMRAFVAMHKYISNDLIEQKYINNLVLEDHDKIALLQESFSKFEEKKKASEIYFNGQIYDAYSKIVDLMKEAKKELIIIDNYADKQVLDMVRNVSVKVKLVVRKNSLLKSVDILKYKEQYDNLEIVYDNTYHGRYLIIDKLKVYHLGTSINYIGSKTFSINTISDIDIINMLVNKVCNC